jgi:hypothetical protein
MERGIFGHAFSHDGNDEMPWRDVFIYLTPAFVIGILIADALDLTSLEAGLLWAPLTLVAGYIWKARRASQQRDEAAAATWPAHTVAAAVLPPAFGGLPGDLSRDRGRAGARGRIRTGDRDRGVACICRDCFVSSPPRHPAPAVGASHGDPCRTQAAARRVPRPGQKPRWEAGGTRQSSRREDPT